MLRRPKPKELVLALLVGVFVGCGAVHAAWIQARDARREALRTKLVVAVVDYRAAKGVYPAVNDLLCIPIFVPLMVFGLRRLGARPDDGPPRAHEILIPLLSWGYLFEVLLPRTDTFGRLTTADPADFLAYTIGAGAAAAYWSWRYPDLTAAESPPP